MESIKKMLSKWFAKSTKGEGEKSELTCSCDCEPCTLENCDECVCKGCDCEGCDCRKIFEPGYDELELTNSEKL